MKLKSRECHSICTHGMGWRERKKKDEGGGLTLGRRTGRWASSVLWGARWMDGMEWQREMVWMPVYPCVYASLCVCE